MSQNVEQLTRSGARALCPPCVLERFGVAANATDMEELHPGFAPPKLNQEHEQLKTHELLFGMVLCGVVMGKLGLGKHLTLCMGQKTIIT